MRSNPCHQFIVDVAFFSGDEPFASESYIVPADSESDACARALRLSRDSVYDDPRIPDLSRTAIIRPVLS